MRRFARVFLVSVLAVDLLFAAAMLVGVTTTSFAQRPPAQGEPEESSDPTPSRWTQEALQLLGRELTARAEELDARQLELEEMMRGVEVLKRATADGTAAPGLPRPAAGRPGAALAGTSRQELFGRLQKTYENMEPESAAAAIAELAVLDKEAVIELILGWKPRVSGAVLDALTLNDPALAADLSYGIWLRSGKNQGATAAVP